MIRHFIYPLLQFMPHIVLELSILTHRVCFIIVGRFPTLITFLSKIELDGIVTSCDGRNIPVNISELLDAASIVVVYQTEEVNQSTNAESKDSE